MGRVIRHDSSVAVPVGRAQLIDPGAFRLGGAEVQAVGQIGGVLQQLGKQRQVLDDNIGRTRISKIKKNAELEWETFKESTPETDTWEENRTKIFDKAQSEISQVGLSGNQKQLEDELTQGWIENTAARESLIELKQLQRNALILAREDYVDDITAGDFEGAQESLQRVNDAAGVEMSKGEIEQFIESATEEGEKEYVTSFLNTADDLMQAGNYNAALKQTENAEEALGLMTHMDPSSKRAAKGVIGATRTSIMADNKRAVAQQQIQLETSLYDGLADGTKTAVDVANSPLHADAKRRLISDDQKMKQMDIDKKWPLVDNDETIQRLESLLTSVESGQIDRNQFDRQVNEAAIGGNLLRETRDKYRGLSKKGGRDAIDAAVKVETDAIKNALLTRLTDREARFVVRSQAGTLSMEDQRQAGNNAFLLQVNRHQTLIIEKEIERIMRQEGRDRVSGTEATAISSTIWEQFRLKTLEQKINDFKEFSGQRVPQPDGFPDSKWEGLDSQGRADVVEAIDRGMTPEDILKVISP